MPRKPVRERVNRPSTAIYCRCGHRLCAAAWVDDQGTLHVHQGHSTASQTNTNAVRREDQSRLVRLSQQLVEAQSANNAGEVDKVSQHMRSLVESRDYWTAKCPRCKAGMRGRFDDLVPVVRDAVNAGRRSVEVPRSFVLAG